MITSSLLLQLSILNIIFVCIISIYYIVKDVSVPNKLLYYDLLFFSSMAFLIIFAVVYKEELYLDLMIVWALVSYIGPLSFARFYRTRKKENL